jgi:hypothetical protein
MHTFAKKPKATQQTTSAKSTKPIPSFVGQNRYVSSILHLQRTIGNQAVLRILQSEVKESDTPSQSIQRNTRPLSFDDPEQIKKTAEEGVKGSGDKLPHLEKIQASFGNHDLSNIRAHIGGAAGKANHAIGAKAYTIGNTIAFKVTPDVHTAAHEAAHVLQQRGNIQLPNRGVGQVGDKYERHADSVANRVVAGQSSEDLLNHSVSNYSQRIVQMSYDEFMRLPTPRSNLFQEILDLNLLEIDNILEQLGTSENPGDLWRRIESRYTSGTAQLAYNRLIETRNQLQAGREGTWTPPDAGVVQNWISTQIDHWHTGATQALSHFRDAIQEESSVGFWLGLAGNVLWATGAIFPPAGAVATGLTGVAIATIGSEVQRHRQEAEYQRVQDIYDDLLVGINNTRSQMDARVIEDANRVMALDSFQNTLAQQDTSAWQRVVRDQVGVPNADDITAVWHTIERNLYVRYLRDRAAWVEHDIFNLPSPHHPGTESEYRHFSSRRIPDRVIRRLEAIGVDWHRIDELPIPHRHRELYRREGTIGAIEYWNYDEDTDFPPSWTEAERREFLSHVPTYLCSPQSGVTY